MSGYLRHVLQVNQVHGSNLDCIEGMFRRLQTLEFVHGERAREAESNAAGGPMCLEEQHVFAGTTGQYGNVMVCPLLLEHVRAKSLPERRGRRAASKTRRLAARAAKKAA